MTKREMYNAILAGEINDEVLAQVKAELDAMDATNAKRAVKAAEKREAKEAEKAPIREAIMAVISDEPKTASMLIEDAGLSDSVKPASVPSLLRPLVECGMVLKVDVKIPGKGTQRGYIKA